MHWALKSWRCWLGLVVLLAPALLLAAALRMSGGALYARNDVVAALNPRGGLWVYWGTTRTKEPETVAYSTEGMTYIVTHQRDGRAGVQAVAGGARRGWLAPVWAHQTTPTPFGGGQGLSVLVSLWWLTLGAAVVSAGLGWAAWKRRPRGSGCAACGYSRAGLAKSAACPECGLAAA